MSASTRKDKSSYKLGVETNRENAQQDKEDSKYSEMFLRTRVPRKCRLREHAIRKIARKYHKDQADVVSRKEREINGISSTHPPLPRL